MSGAQRHIRPPAAAVQGAPRHHLGSVQQSRTGDGQVRAQHLPPEAAGAHLRSPLAEARHARLPQDTLRPLLKVSATTVITVD